MKVPVEKGYLKKMQNNNGRKESEAESSPQEHHENTIFALHTLLSSAANLSRYLDKNRGSTKIKAVMFVKHLRDYSSPFPGCGNKDTLQELLCHS